MFAKRYSNPNDPRVVVYVSHLDRRLGSALNWAHASKFWRYWWPNLLMAAVYLLALVAVWHFFGSKRIGIVNIAVLPIILILQLLWRKNAETELKKHPGPRGPRTPDGLGAAEDLLTAKKALHDTWWLLAVSLGILYLLLFACMLLNGTLWYKALLGTAWVTGIFGSFCVLVMSLLPLFRSGARIALSGAVLVLLVLSFMPVISFCERGRSSAAGHFFKFTPLALPTDPPKGFTFAERLREVDGDFVVDSPFELKIGSTEYAKQLADKLSGNKDDNGDWEGFYSGSVKLAVPYFGVDHLSLSFKGKAGALEIVSLHVGDRFMNDASVGMTLAECRAKFSEICSDIEHRLGVRFERTTRKSDKEAARMIDDELTNPNWRKGGSVIGFSRTFLWSGARMRVGESIVNYSVSGMIDNKKTCSVSVSISR
jgi:hypothetical protein